MTRILAVAAVLAMLCPTLSSAGDVVAMLEQTTPAASAPAPSIINKNALPMTPRPKLKLACAGAGSACGPGYDSCCPQNPCYIPPNNTYGECQY